MSDGPIERALHKLGTDEYSAAVVYAYLLAPIGLEEDCLRVIVERHFPDEAARDAVLETASEGVNGQRRLSRG